MAKYFTHYWSNETIECNNNNSELVHTAGNLFRKRGVRVGDYVFIVTVKKGQLYVVCYLKVAKYMTQQEAEIYLNNGSLWEANEHLIAHKPSVTDFNRVMRSSDAKKLLFEGHNGRKMSLKFKADGYLDQQTLRGVRRLTVDSGRFLKQFVDNS